VGGNSTKKAYWNGEQLAFARRDKRGKVQDAAKMGLAELANSNSLNYEAHRVKPT
jgi:hypothetical protein